MKGVKDVSEIIKQTIELVPQIKPHLSNKARWIAAAKSGAAYKSQEYFLRQIEGLVRGVYDGYVRGEFIDTMANLISGQIYDAYNKAWIDEGGTGELPDYLSRSYQEMVSNQYGYVDQYYRDIIDAALDQTSIGPLLARAQLWANRWNESYNEAVKLITIEGGGNMVWNLGATEKHCPFCSAYNGIVARASEWDALGIMPQGAPNPSLTGSLNGDKGCEGWKCDCSLEPTDKRRSPNAYGRLEEILNSR